MIPDAYVIMRSLFTMWKTEHSNVDNGGESKKFSHQMREKSIYNYLPTKLRECNVLSQVCLSTRGIPCHHYPWYIEPRPTGTPPLYRAPALPPVQGFPRHVQTSSRWTSLCRNPLDIFKLVHYEARMVGKRVVGVLLECFLVFKVTMSNKNKDSLKQYAINFFTEQESASKKEVIS